MDKLVFLEMDGGEIEIVEAESERLSSLLERKEDDEHFYRVDCNLGVNVGALIEYAAGAGGEGIIIMNFLESFGIAKKVDF